MKNLFKSKAFQIINYVLFLAIGIGLLYIAFKNQNFEEIKKAFSEANFYWLIPVILFNIFGSTLRALRWQMLMNSIGHHPKMKNTYNTLMLGYFVSIAVPRLGEITRCITLQKKEKIPFTASFGTVMAERLVDFFMLACLIGLAFVLTYNEFGLFFEQKIFTPLGTLFEEKVLNSPKMLLIIALIIVGIIYVLFNNRKKIESKQDTIDNYINELWIGINSILKLKNYPLFVIYTLLIWVSYFMTSYLWLFSFKETAGLGISVGIAIMAIGTIGRSVPIQGGGMGAYHYLVAAGLTLFGVSQTIGNAYAIVNHGTSTLFQIIVGSIGGLILLLTKSVPQSESVESVSDSGETGVS
ncbi:MAG: lysylphosphatidylglycerol synthase transmembrane domain-containing protein [Bacteroidota bacterium]|nr:lysylphosphatidylglycerol synthase transmembrane domain-containing protein [Bacteroidota bacterium]